MQNRYKFHTRKSDAQNTENHPKSAQKGAKNHQKTYQKSVRKKDRFIRGFFRKGKTLILTQNTVLLFKNKLREASCEVNARTGNSLKNH